jgi:DNA polymerase III delta prime subunit
MHPHQPLLQKLSASRQELLDLGLRNPLLNYRLSPARGVRVVEEWPAGIFEVLVRQGRAMTFLPAPNPGKDSAGTPERTEEEREALFIDTKLQTADPLPKLESRLLNTYYTARTSLEEQGVNILYLALGMLQWYEADRSEEPRHAPLVLVPVELVRSSARERFKLRYTGAEVEGNLSLLAKLRTDLGLELPPLPDLEESSLNTYFSEVAKAVQDQPRWLVDRRAIALGFFSFSKLMLYRDLDLLQWPPETNVLEHPVLQALFETGFQEPRPSVPEDAFLDTESSVHELHQVVDADSSQLLAMLAVHEGRNLVIQGPPGTGKSQTITNLLAEAIGAGKRVLFVAEKMAALEVVKRRLDTIGLGAACLELHSHKANKKALHDELKRTLELNRPVLHHLAQEVALLDDHREELNAYCAAVNGEIGRSGLSPQQVMGELLQINEEREEVNLPRLFFAGMNSWTATDVQRLEALAGRMQALLQKIHTPRDLAFWGSGLLLLLPADRDRLAVLLREARQQTAYLAENAETVAATLRVPAPQDRPETEKLLSPTRQALLAPSLTGVSLLDPAWLERRAELQRLLEAGKALADLKKKNEQMLLEEAWGQDVLDIRTQLLAYGDKWWKFLIGDYNKAKQRLQGLARQPLPKDLPAQLALVDDILTANRHGKTLEQGSAFASSLFGAGWQGERSDWQRLQGVAEYLASVHEGVREGRLPSALLSYLHSQPDLPTLRRQLAALEAAVEDHRFKLKTLTEALQLDEMQRFGSEGRLFLHPYLKQQEKLQRWSDSLTELPLVIDWNNLAQTARQEGLGELVSLAEGWPHGGRLLRAVLRQNWLEYLLAQAFREREPLRTFERAGHEEVIGKFRSADQMQLHYNRAKAALAHWEQVPRFEARGQLGVLKYEFNKRARHLPIRRLIEQAGLAIQAIKPVFMMSPLSIANFLPPGALHFDLVVFDEASQVKPVDALGAILRGRQLVVVGDSKQLPPTSFFDALTGNLAEDEEESVTADMQSILGLCEARQAPQRMLRWHYRSQHESLIRLSNHEFYENRLVIFPSPGGQGQRLGLVFHHLPGTVYERSSSRTNPLEAEAVAEAVMAHARQHPRLTLGVVAFSTAQRQAIEEALEAKRRASPETEEYFARHPHEPFFIKNLENVQGDERDVIFISIGYGRTAEGYLNMSFGPLNLDGGERRLNVLITRAKQRCEVFSNFTADDLDLERSKARGVAALKSFLYYAQHGRLNVPHPTGRDLESPFEESVYRALTGLGYTMHPQVGSEGFYLDLAIVDPEQPGRYLLGIEGDGAMYDSARSARDRDRLRQQVLENVGWKLHRIWSTDWFRDPHRELQRVEAALRRAGNQAPLAKEEGEPAPDPPGPAPELLRKEGAVVKGPPLPPYQVAQLPAAVASKELHQHNLNQLAVWVTEIVRVEGPVHLSEVARRLAEAAGASRIGTRIREVLEKAVRLAIFKGPVRQEGEFLWPSILRQPELRDRSGLPATSRKLPLVAPEELALAVQQVVSRSFAIERSEVPAGVVQLLGFGRLSEEMRGVVESMVGELVRGGVLVESGGKVMVG